MGGTEIKITELEKWDDEIGERNKAGVMKGRVRLEKGAGRVLKAVKQDPS